MPNYYYTAEDDAGERFVVASYPGLTDSGFRDLVLTVLSNESIPNPDREIFHLDLLKFNEANYLAWLGNVPPAGQSWAGMIKRAWFDQLQWSYPGEWVTHAVTSMPIDLAREFGQEIDAYPPDDPKSDGYHDRAVAAWDGREK